MIFLLRLPSLGVIEKMERTIEEVRYFLNKVDKYLVNAWGTLKSSSTGLAEAKTSIKNEKDAHSEKAEAYEECLARLQKELEDVVKLNSKITGGFIPKCLEPGGFVEPRHEDPSRRVRCGERSGGWEVGCL